MEIKFFLRSNESQFLVSRKERPSSPLLKLELSPTILFATDSSFVGKLSAEHFHVERGPNFVCLVIFADFASKSSHNFMCFISKKN